MNKKAPQYVTEQFDLLTPEPIPEKKISLMAKLYNEAYQEKLKVANKNLIRLLTEHKNTPDKDVPREVSDFIKSVVVLAETNEKSEQNKKQ